MSAVHKYGECVNDSNRTTHTSNCYDDCDGQDWRCSAAEKCCWNNCNRLCQPIENLERISIATLPSIPANVTVLSAEFEQRRTTHISWQMRAHNSRYNELIDYIIEARAHVGYTFAKHKLSHWFPLNIDYIQMERKHKPNYLLYVFCISDDRIKFAIVALNFNRFILFIVYGCLC